MKKRSREEKKAIADFVDCYLLGKPPEGMELVGFTLNTWRGNLKVQYLKKKSGPKTVPVLLKRPQFPGPCTFPCHQSTSEDTWSLHYHWIMEECSEQEAIDLKNDGAIVFQGPDNILLVREDEMNDVLAMMKTFYLFDFAPLWNERKSCRLKRLVYSGFMHGWRIEKTLNSANETEQIEYIKKKSKYSLIALPPRNIFDIDPKNTVPVVKYGRIYFHQLVEKSMLDRRHLPDIDHIKKLLANVNHQFFHCRGCAFDPETNRRHYHYVMDTVYQACKEFKSSVDPCDVEGLVNPEALEIFKERPKTVIRLGQGDIYLVHLTEYDIDAFKNMCEVRFGNPIGFPILNQLLESFFTAEYKGVWKHQKEENSDQYEHDTRFPAFTSPHELVAPEEVNWQPQLSLQEAFERLTGLRLEDLEAAIQPDDPQPGPSAAPVVPAVAVVASTSESNGDTAVPNGNQAAENGIVDTPVENGNIEVNGTVEVPEENMKVESVENGTAGTSTSHQNGQSQQIPNQLNGLLRIEQPPQKTDHASNESNGLPLGEKRKASEDGPSKSDGTSPQGNKRAKPDSTAEDLWTQLQHLGPSTSRVCFPGS